MCRICGRVVKCIFDSMPSRIHTAPRRAFTTVRTFRSPLSISQKAAPSSPTLSLARVFSGLSMRPSTTTTSSLNTNVLRSSLQSHTTSFALTSRLAQPSLTRLFSTTSALSGYRRRMDTFSPSRRVQKRRSGYLARLKTQGGRAVLKRRRLKGRLYLSW